MIREDSVIHSSGENVIELIQEHRDELISRICVTSVSLHTYLSEQFQLNALSEKKPEFITRALLELKSSSIDLTHYAALILETRKNGSLSISRNTEQYFVKDIERTIQNYI